MQHHIDISVEVGKKDVKAGDKNAPKGTVNKFLSAARLRESFNLNFESAFLDMFVDRPVEHAQKVEAPKPAEQRIARADEGSRNVGNNDVSCARHQEYIERPKTENVEAAPAPESAEPATQEAAEAPVEANDAAPAERPKEKPVEKIEESRGEGLSAQMKMVRVELKAQIQKLLTDDQKAELKNKIQALLDDEDASAHDLLAGMMAIVADLVGPVQSAEVVTVEAEGQMTRDTKKFVKRFLEEVSKALDSEENTQQIAEQVTVEPQMEQRIENALSKLVRKMDRNITDADRELVKNIAAPTPQSGEVKAGQEVNDRPIEGPKRVKEAVKEAVRVDAPAIREDDRTRDARNVVEADAAAALVRAKARAVNAPAPISNAGGVNSIGDIARSAKADGGAAQNWQNSYGQNSSTKFMEKTQEARRNEAPRPAAQNPIFDQVIQSAKITVTDGKSEATIKLNPDFLGKVEMKVLVEDGKVNVKFTAENSVVQNAILENINDLKRSLTEAGLDVENVLVSLADQSMDAETGEGDEQENQDAPRYRGTGGIDEDFIDAIDTEISDGSTVRYLA